MAIQFRRGNETDLDISQLKAGELAVCLDTGKIIVKLSGENYLTLTDVPALRQLVDGKVDAESGKGLSEANFTIEEKNKLNGVAAGAEVNQNTFSKIKVGSTTVAADAKQDTLEFVAGSNVTITPDATNDKITIAATDTVYTHPTYTARTGKPAANQTPTFGSTVTISQVKSDATGHITGMTDRTIKIPDKTMTGASENAAGAAGLVPPPSAGEQEKFLRGDGKWAALSFLSISTYISSKDFNAYTTSGIWYFGDLNSLGMTNRPVTSTNDAGFLIVFGGGYSFQIFLGAYQSKIYYRGNNGSWQAWKTVG